MDKRQKQLIDTYIRKRTIASAQSDRYTRTLKELQYMQSNGYNLGEISHNESVLLDPSLYDQNDYYGTTSLTTLLSQIPELIAKTDISKLNAYNRELIILKQPQYFDAVNANDFTPHHIYAMILAHPSLVSKFTKEQLDSIEYYYIPMLLIAHPELLQYFDSNKIEGYRKIDIIAARPELLEKMDLSNVSPYYIAQLISKSPQFYDHFSNVKFSSSDMVDMLLAQPLLLDKINFNNLGSYSMSELVENVPSVINYLDDKKIEEMSYKLLQNALVNPRILDEPKMKELLKDYDVYTIKDFIIKKPQYAHYFDLSKLSAWGIESAIISTPALLKNPAFNAQLSKLNDWNISDILNKKPKLAPFFAKLKRK